MPATTPINALPYPLGTDLVSDGDDAIHNLALALDGTVWVNISVFTNGWTNFGSGLAVARYRKQAGLVWLQGVIKPGTSGAAAFTLPAGFRSTAATELACASGTAAAAPLAAFAYTDSTGLVSPAFVAGAAWVSIEARFPVI